ncbi:hypothetical protein HW555_003872, partial [Spodoptera exigua]
GGGEFSTPDLENLVEGENRQMTGVKPAFVFLPPAEHQHCRAQSTPGLVGPPPGPEDCSPGDPGGDPCAAASLGEYCDDIFEKFFLLPPNSIMECWDALVAAYPDDPAPIDYAKAIRTANIIIAEELAPFETEWLTTTLFFKPIYLFDTIKSNTKRKDEGWVKNIADSFKILSKLIDTNWDAVESYKQEIIELGSLSFDAQTRKEAILCLLKIVKRPSVVLTDEFVSNVIRAFDKATNCKAPLAELVGALCRYFPENVKNGDHHKLLIYYQNMLERHKHSKNLTSSVLMGVLKGIDDMLINFGKDEEIYVLKNLYTLMSGDLQQLNSKVMDVVLSILEHHAGLFKEVLANDKSLRDYLWLMNKKNAMDALINIYEVILPSNPQKEIIISSEIIPRRSSQSILVKHTALKVLMQASAGEGEGLVLSSGVDLEYQLMTKRVDYDGAATISWCIESNLSNSGNMLLTSIMFYDNLPTNKKRDIVVKGIMKANDDIRKAALILLLKLSLQEGLDKYIYIWRSILDNYAGPDLAKAVMIFKETIQLILQDLAITLSNKEKSFMDVKPTLSLLSVLLSLQQTECDCVKWCHSIVPSIVHLASFYRQEPLKMIQEMPDDEMPYVEMFQEDTVYKTLLNVMSTDRQSTYDGTLSSFQAIFSKEDTDYKVLIKILGNLETVIEDNSNNLDKRQLSLVINQIERLKSKVVLNNKDARAFQKDAIMFLAKFGRLRAQANFSEDIYTLKLKNKVNLNVPNVVQGLILKIDLQRILQLCLVRGETEALYCLLVILTANLRDRSDPDLQEATIRVIHEIFRSSSGRSETEIAVHPALFFCNTAACVQAIIKGITEELDPNVRRKLSEHLHLLLTQDPGSEATEELLNVVAEHSSFMITRDKASVYLPDLDILRAFLPSILDNNALIIEYLPKILTCTSKINDACDLFENASNIFVEKVDLFTQDQILQLLKDIIENYSVNLYNTESIINNVTDFIKRIFDIKKYELKTIIVITLSMLQALTAISPQFSHLVTLLAYLNSSFEFDNGLRRMVVEFENSKILEQFLTLVNFEEEDIINAGFIFLREFSNELLEVNTEKTYKCLGLLIENVTPQSIITFKINITTCLSRFQTRPRSLDPVKENFRKWFAKLNLEEMTGLIEKWFHNTDHEELITQFAKRELFAKFTKEISIKVHALKIISEYSFFEFDAKNLTLVAMRNIDGKLGRIFLIDLLSVCEKHLSDDEFSFLLQNHFDFLKTYCGVYFKRFIRGPYVLKDEVQSMILIDIMNYFATAFDKDCFQRVLNLINYLWPSFENISNFESKLSILTNVLSLPETVGLDCPPVGWASTLMSAKNTKLEDRIKILHSLPAGDEFKSLYLEFASHIPVRLSDMQEHEKFIPGFRALLDSLARNGDKTLLNIVLTLAKGDETKGWWDQAFSACMKSLAAKEDLQILNEVYKKVVEASSKILCERILLPLLRHTPRKLFEEYLCTTVTDLLNIIKHGEKGPSNTDHYKKRVANYSIVLNILKIAFDKLPTQYLETGPINDRAGSSQPWYFLKTVSMYCVTVRRSVHCPDGASEELKQTCLWLQTSSYNCLSAAICRRKITQSLSSQLFNVQVWASIVDKDAVYPFYLKSYMRSREQEEEVIQEFEDNVLNAHGCLSTITYLFEHASKLDHYEWRDTVVRALSDDTELHTNAKWMLAQAICNASEDLKPHASVLCPALFKLISDTSSPSSNDNGKPVLNNLHVEILTTIIKWGVNDLAKPPNMDACIELLINTCIDNKSQYYIQKRLLDTLNGILQLYGNVIKVEWDIFQDYFYDLPTSLISILPILERIVKNGSSLPILLPAMFCNENSNHWINNATKLSEITGLAFLNSDAESRKDNLDKFRRMLHSVRSSNVGSYVKMLFYSQRKFAPCCDDKHLKIITNLATKIEKSKCLSIISTYFENASTVDNINDIIEIIDLQETFDSDMRVEAMKVARHGLKFMCLDVKTEILKGVEPNCRSSSVTVRKEALKVFLKAFQELVKRVEVTNPAKKMALDSTPILDIIDSASTLDRDVVKIVSDGMFDHDETVAKEICDGVEECLSQDLKIRFAELFYIIVYQRSLTENSFQLCCYGSKLIEMLFSGLRSEESFEEHRLREEGLAQSVLRAFDSPAVTQTRTVRTSLRSGMTYRRKVDKGPEKRDIDLQMPVTDILEINSQICQELCVQVMKCVVQISHRRFSDSVMSLKQAVSNSEGYLYTNILLEDLLIRNGDKNFFVFSFENEDYDSTMTEEGFTMEGLIQAFGSLSNWNDQRLQDKKRIEDTLPKLWTKNEEFTVSLKDYFDNNKNNLDYGLWFNKMLASYYTDVITQNKLSWLKHIERWPKNDFVTSAIIEAIQWHQNDVKMFGTITRDDCLAEWSARLMIRSSFFNHLDSDGDSSLSLSKQELLWCKEANDRGLPSLVLQCIERNKDNNIPEDEILPWFLEKVKAYRAMGLKQKDLGILEKALTAAETYKLELASQSSVEKNICIQKVILDLHYDLNSISKLKMDDIIQEVSSNIQDVNSSEISKNSCSDLKSVYDTALAYYDDIWPENDEISQNDLILAMTRIIEKVLDLNLTRDCNLLLAILFNRISQPGIYRVFPRLDFCSIAILKKIISMLPATVVDEKYLLKLQDVELNTCKEYFKLICDANYALRQFCEDLRKNVLNDEEFDVIYKKMKKQIFENQFGGTDYQSLSTLKTRLYALENMDDIDSKAVVLKEIINELRKKPDRTILRLSQLCPGLCSPKILEKNKVHLQRLLRLPPNVHVVKFIEQVTPLGEDSAIIEYLEDHRRLRELIDINTPGLALEQYNEMCAQVTPYVLRSAIEESCSCVQEFIAKKRMFEDTLSSMTILCWLFGVGDRHLQNIMYNTRDGGVCAVDWASMFNYGSRELPPARLTANLLAVCDIKVLESRLQQMLLYLRKQKKIFETYLRISFYWLGPDFKELKYLNDILEGKTVSYLITRECIDESDIKNKMKYIALLDDVFQNFLPKQTYSVEEQVSCLLKHCTQPSILAVTRRGWEAWL